jgi:hypothetical protein
MTDKTTEEPVEIKLARGLLEIAHLAMPEAYFATDSRCELAREVLKRHGIIWTTADEC